MAGKQTAEFCLHFFIEIIIMYMIVYIFTKLFFFTFFSVAMYVWIAVESIHIYRMLSELRDINHGRTTFYSGIYKQIADFCLHFLK